MTKFNENHPLVLSLKGWDRVRPTANCPHCKGTNKAPGDGRTECGFCDPNMPKEG